MRLQSILKTIHIWIGLTCGLVLSITCVSGTIAVFRPQIQAAFTPTIAPSGQHADLDQAIARVLAANPGARLTRVGLPAPDHNAFLLQLDDGQPKPRRIVIDGGTGAIAGELKLQWLDWIIDLHHNLVGGKTGRRVVGAVGIVLFVTSLSGLVLSLLRAPSWKHLVTINSRGPRRRFYFELHRATGLWAYALLTLLSFTGIALSYPEAFRAVLGKRAPIARPDPSTAGSLLPVSIYIAASRAALPAAELTELRLPEKAGGAVSMRFRLDGDAGELGRNELSLDASGRILGVRRISGDPFGVRLQTFFTPLHYGEVGGLAARILWAVAGMAPLVLFITGLLVWFRKKPAGTSEKQRQRDEFLVTR